MASAATTASQMPSTPMISGRVRMDDLEQQRAQEADSRRHSAVVQRREKRRAENVEPGQNKADGVQLHAVGRQRQQARIIADKDFCQRPGQQLTGSQHRHPGHRNDARTFAQQVFQFVLIVRAKVVADNGRCALRIADEHRREHKAHIISTP